MTTGVKRRLVRVVAAFAGADRCDSVDDTWIDLDPDEFYLDPGAHLPRLYRRYREHSLVERRQ